MSYQKDLDLLIEKLVTENKRPKLLLHACCGPCSSYVLEYLCKFFDITVYYYNPNIYPDTEYNRRLEELKNLYKRFPPVLENKIAVVEEEYNPEDFYKAVGTREQPELAVEAEKGERCRRCYEFRLRKSYEYAKANNFDYFCTTLSISPFKDAEKINVIGLSLSENKNGKQGGQTPKWLPSDFKKKNGFKRSLELSEEYNLYRQTYCGCVYSMKNKADTTNQ